jgi:hypothetical protein
VDYLLHLLLHALGAEHFESTLVLNRHIFQLAVDEADRVLPGAESVSAGFVDLSGSYTEGLQPLVEGRACNRCVPAD